MKILVTGGRDFNDVEMVRGVLTNLKPKPDLLIHGGARGADAICAAIAHELGIPTEMHAPDWEKYGKAAGPIRNRAMADRKPDLLVAFPGGKGTNDMIRRAQKADIRVLYIGMACP